MVHAGGLCRRNSDLSGALRGFACSHDAWYSEAEKALKLIPGEYYRLEGGRLSLTGKGFPVYNYIVSLLLAHKEE